MPVVSKVLARTAATTTTSTIYTTPSTVTAVVTNVIACNPTSAMVTISMLLNDFDLFGTSTINPNETFSFDLKQVLPANQTIKASASSTAVDIHVSGVEIS